MEVKVWRDWNDVRYGTTPQIMDCVANCSFLLLKKESKDPACGSWKKSRLVATTLGSFLAMIRRGRVC